MADVVHRPKVRRPEQRRAAAADAQPDEVSNRLARRLLESFFRRPLVCLLPLVVLVGLGAYTVAGADKKFVSSGVVTVSSETLLSNLTNVPSNQGFTWESPAMVTSRAINELLGTDQFAMVVAEGAGIGEAVENGSFPLSALRSSVGSTPTGNNLVAVRASTVDPQLSYRLANATLDGFVKWVTDSDIAESTAAETFFAGLVETYEAELAAARAALDEYTVANPVDVSGVRTAAERSEISRLTADVDLAEERYSSALHRIEEARLATEQAKSDISQRLRVIDTPAVPLAPESSRKDAIVTLGLYLVGGLLFTVALIVLGAVLDRSVRSAEDVRHRLHIDVLAVVPNVRG